MITMFLNWYKFLNIINNNCEGKSLALKYLMFLKALNPLMENFFIIKTYYKKKNITNKVL